PHPLHLSAGQAVQAVRTVQAPPSAPPAPSAGPAAAAFAASAAAPARAVEELPAVRRAAAAPSSSVVAPEQGAPEPAVPEPAVPESVGPVAAAPPAVSIAADAPAAAPPSGGSPATAGTRSGSGRLGRCPVGLLLPPRGAGSAEATAPIPVRIVRPFGAAPAGMLRPEAPVGPNAPATAAAATAPPARQPLAPAGAERGDGVVPAQHSGGNATAAPSLTATAAEPASTGVPESAIAAAVAEVPAACPRRPRRHSLAVALIAADAVTAVAVVVPLLGRTSATLWLVLVALLVMVTLHLRAGLHRADPFTTALAELPRIAAQSTVGWCVAQTVLVAADAPSAPVLPFLAVVALYPPAVCAARAAVRGARRRTHRRRPRPAVVIAGGPGGGALAGVLGDHPEYGMRPVAVVVPPAHRDAPAPPPGAPGTTAAPAGPPRLSGGDLGAVATLLDGEQVLDAFVVRGPAEPEDPELLELCHRMGCTVWLVEVGPGLSATTGGRAAVPPAGHLWGFACRRLDPPAATPGTVARIAKRGLDIGGAATLLLVAAPLLLGCALAVRLADGPGVLFRQQRIGQDGRPFVILKFRSIRPSDDAEAATRWNVAGDRRMSRVGSLLRRTSLDELPQLWNVLRGDMSLVGPRPERPHFVAEFSRSHPGYARRHRMPAGLTGLAQVSGLRGDTSIEERARFDNHYIDTWSLWQDVSIMLRTSVGCFRCGGS
ncbi:exopolysaccharide biosynthesis polyprenyl glycosylphosphotransferase, partial [Streptomyces lonarensis]